MNKNKLSALILVVGMIFAYGIVNFQAAYAYISNPTTVSGTSNQVTVTNTNGNPVVSLPSTVTIGSSAAPSSSLDVQGSFGGLNITSNVSTTVGSAYSYSFSGAVSSTFTLPLATSSFNRVYVFRNISTSSAMVSLQATSTDLFKIQAVTSTSFVVNQGDSVSFQNQAGAWVSLGPVVQTFLSPLVGGASLTVGTCASTSIAIPADVASSSAQFTINPATDPGPGFYFQAMKIAGSNVSARVCAVATLTPASSTYLVKVIR